MIDELSKFYHNKRTFIYSGYQIGIYENTIVKTISKYVIVVFSNNKKIGELETYNEREGLNTIKARIDQADERGARLVFLNP